MTDVGNRTALPIPSVRHRTKHPGVTFRYKADGSRVYEINYTDSTNRRVFKTIPGNLKDAVRERHTILERMHRGEMVAPSKVTVAELLDDYMDTQTSHLKPSTKKTYADSIKSQIKPALGHMKVSEVRATTIVKLVSDMREKGYSAWYIHGTLTPLSRAFDYAVRRRGLAATNPVKGLEKQEKPKGYGRPMRILSTEEIAAMLRNAEHYRTLLETAVFTGLRVGELMRLKWEDINFDEGVLTVRESKTRAGLRDVVIPDFLLRHLAAMTEETPFVFTTSKKKPIDRAAYCRAALEKALDGVTTDRVRFHDLRHTFASLLIGQGEDVTYVADQMGHANPAITLTIYAKLFDPKQRRQEARKRLDSSFAEVVQ